MTPAGLARLRARHPARRIEVNGLGWRVRDAGGPGPALVLLPGSLGNADIFYRQMLALTPGLRCIAVDYPDASAAELADGLAALLGRLELEAACFAGSSLAGYWLQDFGARYPRHVNAMVLASAFRDSAALREHPLFRPDTLRSLSGAALKAEWLARLEARPPDELRDVQIALLHDGQQGESLRFRLLAAATATPAPAMPVGAFPIGLLDCADDPILTAEVRNDLASHYPGAMRLTLPAGGHYPHVTQVGSFNTFVERIVAVRRPSGTDGGGRQTGGYAHGRSVA